MIRYFHYFLMAAALVSCTASTTWQVLRPANINNIDNIERVAILNRTLSDKGRGINIAEGVLTGETIGADKRGAENCVITLRECLSHSENYKHVNLINGVMKGSGRSYMANPLSWSTVDSLCSINNAQALIVLEFFDSNSGISTVANGGPIPPSSAGTGNANNTLVKTGWRIYVPASKKIIDEHHLETWTTYAKNPNYGAAVDNYIRKNRVIKGTGARAGVEYGFRISEQWVNVAHSYFKGGTPSMKQASRYARAGNWQSATEIWQAEANNAGKRKIKSRALHNLAVHYARIGDNDNAMNFARQSMELRRYGNTMALINYLNIRADEERRLIKRHNKQSNNDYFTD